VITILLAALAYQRLVMTAVKPLGPDEREADRSVNGEVLATYERKVESDWDPHVEYVSLLRIEDHSGANLLYVHYRRNEIPQGSTGPIGQDAVMPPGARVVAYMWRDRDGRWQLLEPNGWESE